MRLLREPPPLEGHTQALIAAARGAHEPNEMNRARVRKGVELKLAAGIGLALVPATTAIAGAAKLTLVVATVGTVVGAGLYKAGSFEKPARPPIVQRTSNIRIVTPAPTPAEKPAPPAPAPAPRRRAAAPAAPADSTSALAQETALLGAANTALAHHDVASALALLDDYDRRGSGGILVEERTVTGILALCAASRVESAQKAARSFRAHWPRSPLSARVDGSCVGPTRSPHGGL